MHTKALDHCTIASFHLSLPPLHVQVEDIRSLTQPVRILLQEGLLFAVHHTEGQSRHGKISLKDGRLHLHSLQDQPPPPLAVTVQVGQGFVSYSCCPLACGIFTLRKRNTM